MKPVSINSRKFLGHYIDAQNNELLPEGLVLSGIILWAVMQTIYCWFGGITTTAIFGFTALAGVTLGLAMKRYMPYRTPSCITVTLPKAPSVDDDQMRKVA